MAPVSAVPGRVRFETNRLLGRSRDCLMIEEALHKLPGVLEASVSHRTGRILVRFDVGRVTQGEIEAELASVLRSALEAEPAEAAHLPVRHRSVAGDDSNFHVGHVAMDMLLHALLPAPLDLLLPAAATAFRR